MLRWLRRGLARLRGTSLERGDHSRAHKRPVENVDALSTGGGVDLGYPPGYVKDYNEGRPRK